MPVPRPSRIETLEQRALLAITPIGPEFRVNTTVAGSQYAPAVASDLAGDYIVVWVSPDADRAGTDIFAQRYAANGTTLGSEFRVNTVTAGAQTQPDVAMDDAGDFTIVWTSENITGGSGRDVVARSYFADGSYFFPSERLVNQTIAGDQESPSIACDRYGFFDIAWDSDSGDGNDYDIYVRPFNFGVSAYDNERRLNLITAGPQTDPTIDMNANGDYAVAWSSATSSTSSDYDIYERTYRNAALKAAVLVSDDASIDYQVLPSVAIAADASTIFAWSSYGGDGSNYGISARTYTSSGTAGSIFSVNTFTAGQQTHATVDASAAGDFTIAWDSADQDGSSRSIDRQSYTRGGATVGGETRVNTTTVNDQSFPAITLNADGDAVIVWQDGSTAINGNGVDGSGYGVFAQRFGNPPTVTVVNFNYLSTPSLSFAFSEDVGDSLSTTDIAVVNTTSNQTLASSAITLSYNATTHVATVTFASTLANGNYTATLMSSGIGDAVGTPLDGNADGVGGDNYVLSFFVLAGDANRDRKVDVVDLGILSSHWQQTGQTFATGDFNGDGKVDVIDLGILSSNWQATVPTPAAIIMAPAKRVVSAKRKGI